ncbi:hypothetical protein [Marinomonas sp. 5E14-1]|uniref:hypothetical protein n=1 Tax=Marinomonas sp. 5E14-1 TaxID=3153922 RepID=UPI003262E762
MSISSISNNSLYMPSLSMQADKDTHSNPREASGFVQISDQAKHMLANQNQAGLLEKTEEEKEGKETVQITSSIGRLSRISGLQREEVADLYRSIDSLS